MREQNSDGNRKANVAVPSDPVTGHGMSGVCVVYQPSKMPALEGYRGQQRCDASSSTHISHYIGCTVTVTALGVFWLRKEPVGGVDHAASRALRQPFCTLDEQYAGAANKRIRESQGGGRVRAIGSKSRCQRCRRQYQQRLLGACC